MAEPLSETAAAVRRGDRDRFLTALFAPAAARESLFALYAFNLEIAKVRETVSEPMLGRIRLQWWREAIDEIEAGKVREHPVVRALAKLVGPAAPAPLTRAYFDRLIDAREFDLDGRAPATLGELEAYGEGTSSSLLWLAAEALGARQEATRRALTPLGIAWSITGLVRAMPFFARARRNYVPADIARGAGLSEEALFAWNDDAAIARAAALLADHARRHLAEADTRRRAIEPSAKPLLLFGSLARGSLARLARKGHHVTAGDTDIPPAAKVLRLWWASRFR